ncbi:MAG TPA: cation:dicarboxylase symporter family transporter [Candidatus Nitrosopolaris sp.]|nr:cation:dicarboxylase symporter family transporter [Candidatus Nitrosopolaris sp.]
MEARATEDRLAPSPVLTGLLLGVACGLFFGELVRPLEFVANAFIRLLQMAVLPYIVFSLTAAVGRLSLREARFLAGVGGGLMAALWALALAATVAMPLAFPESGRAGFFSTTLVTPHEDFDLVKLYIPDNPFRSLADNVVPAVVIFCLTLGSALIGLPGREPLIALADVMTKALERVNGFIMRLMPIGVFAIAAVAAGTLGFEEVGRIEVFLGAYIVLTCLVGLWVIPAFVAVLLGSSVRVVLRSAREVLATAFSTGSMLLVLPALSHASLELAVRRAPDDEETRSAVDVLVPISFNFPHAGKLLTLGFVLFAAWFVGRPLSPSALARFALAGVVAAFGSMNVALPFMLDAFALPADFFQLFLVVAVVIYRFQTLAGAMHTLALTVLGACAVRETLVIQWSRIARTTAVSVVVVGLGIVATRALLAHMVGAAGPRRSAVRERTLTVDPVPSTVRSDVPPAENGPGSALDRIARTGELRIAHPSARLPFSYLNTQGELVGFDVDMMHRLARELGARLVFVPLDRARLSAQLAAGQVDLAIGGLEVTTALSRRVGLSQPYLHLTMALVVEDRRRDELGTREALLAHPPLRLALVSDEYYEAKLRAVLPHVEIVRIDAAKRFFQGGGLGLDGLVVPAEIGEAWTLIYPEYTVVRPSRLRAPIAFGTAREDADFRNFLDTWILLKREDGTIDALRRYWIDGLDDRAKTPRWSIVRDVLHWVQ